MKTLIPTLRKLSALVLCLFFIAASNTVFAQENDRKAKVTIKKSDNGNETEINEEINIEDAKDLELLLEKYGIDTELEELKDDEVLEITIQRKKDNKEIEDIIIKIDPDQFDFDFDFDIDTDNAKVEKETIAFWGVVGESMCTNGEMKPGTKITKVVEGSKAEEYGIEKGDVITKFGDTEIKGFSSLSKAIKSYNPGDKVTVEFEREGKKQTKEFELGSKEVNKHRWNYNHNNWSWDWDWKWDSKWNQSSKPFLGVTHGDSDELEKGVKIGRAINNTTAEKMGLEGGDVILNINGSETNSWSELVEAIQKVDVDEEVDVTYIRDGQTQTATGTMQSKYACGERKPFDKEKMEKMQKELREKMELNEEELKLQFEEGKLQLELLLPDLEKFGEEFGNDFEELIKEIKINIEVLEISEDDMESTGMSKTDINSLIPEKFNLFPNPNSGNFSVELLLTDEANTTLRVIDLQGAEVFSEVISDFSGEYQREIDLTDQAKGTYFVQVRRGDKATTKKIIIQ